MRETALKSRHSDLGARLVDFAGWQMPVQYTGILEEAAHVRRYAGLFDLGHMGRVRVRGPQAEAFLQRLQTNDAAKIPAGAIRYALILDADGLTQDDILIYRHPVADEFFLVINAGNTARDLAIMHDTAKGFDVTLLDQTDELGMFAIQGPASQAITQQLTDFDLSSLRYYNWAVTHIAGVAVELSRTGYTGEDGFEVYAPQARTAELWDAFLEAGADHQLRATGLGARDTLRLEAGMPLYGHEIDETTNPLEAGLEFGVKFTHDFTGRTALEQIRQAGGPARRLVGLTTESRRVPRQGYPVSIDGRDVGAILSGAISPTLGRNIATTYLPTELAVSGTPVEFRIRQASEPATVHDLPFYKRPR
ncbi:MAG: glycine cleavage system aminomethyltransferase GcvT [Planctomycetes bacterium]|nr:glycine cleavage system aminomethyltransferase GcvT [Planctomycetota bacterium]